MMMTPAEVVRYQELAKYIDEQLSNNERLALIAYLLGKIDPKLLIPAKGWMLTEQAHKYNVLTVNLSGSVCNKHSEGTISFVVADNIGLGGTRGFITRIVGDKLKDSGELK